jgi:hypothetical protein
MLLQTNRTNPTSWVLASFLFAGCAAPPLVDAMPSTPVIAAPTRSPGPPPNAPWESRDDADELFDCLGPDTCPANLEDRARHRAAASFGCQDEQIVTKARPASGLVVHGSTMIFGGGQMVEVHAQAAEGGDAFEVSGCGWFGVLDCVHANRTVRNSRQTYENTADRVCLWAHPPKR